jgi:hypothetical protein
MWESAMAFLVKDKIFKTTDENGFSLYVYNVT